MSDLSKEIEKSVANLNFDNANTFKSNVELIVRGINSHLLNIIDIKRDAAKHIENIEKRIAEDRVKLSELELPDDICVSDITGE